MVQGVVVLTAVFSASGQITNIHVVRGLSDGLNDSAIDAARKIEFEPAIKDGKPVATKMQLEYRFNIY